MAYRVVGVVCVLVTVRIRRRGGNQRSPEIRRAHLLVFARPAYAWLRALATERGAAAERRFHARLLARFRVLGRGRRSQHWSEVCRLGRGFVRCHGSAVSPVARSCCRVATVFVLRKNAHYWRQGGLRCCRVVWIYQLSAYPNRAVYAHVFSVEKHRATEVISEPNETEMAAHVHANLIHFFQLGVESP